MKATSLRQVKMNPPQITIEEFRQLYPALFSDPAVEDNYCNTGWRGILISFCDTLQRQLNRHPEVPRYGRSDQVESRRTELLLRRLR